MERIVYLGASLCVRALQRLPLRVLARLGRAGGAVAWGLDRRHRAVVLENLRRAFPEKSASEIRAVGRENMLRIGENYASALKTAVLPLDEVSRICEVTGLEKFPDFTRPGAPSNCIVAIGHFGNFELNATLGKLVPGLRPATTFRGLKQPALNALMQNLRERSGCHFYERRTQGAELKSALNAGGMLLGLLADQHAGNSGVWLPFFGRLCSTSPAPAVLALRYDALLFTAICYRKGLARWRIELGDEIPLQVDGAPRAVEDITADMNRAFESAIRRDPANWFWVHKRWKAPPKRKAGVQPAFPAQNNDPLSSSLNQP